MIFQRSMHANLETIASFVSSELPESERSQVAAHIRECTECQDALRFIHRLDAESVLLPNPVLRADHLKGIVAARARGESAEIAPALKPSGRHSWRTLAAAAAVLVVISLASYLRRPGELLADPSRSTMELTPGKPTMGESIHVRYQPAIGLFDGADSLILRAVLRKPSYPMYIGVRQVAPVAVLRRAGDGRFGGDFVLPDSTVYAMLAVESADAQWVDDNEGRLWELLTYEGARPSYDAVRQRVHAMMGRNWEAAAASARQLGDLYPDRVESWALREFFDRALLGSSAADARARVYAQRRDSLIRSSKSTPRLSYEDAGTIFFGAWMRARDTTATAADSVELAYWWTRLLREYPKHDQVAQRLALELGRMKDRPQVVLDSVDRLYRGLAPIHGPGRNLFQVPLKAATKVRNDSLQRVWTERSLAESPDSARRVAEFLAMRPRFRHEGISRLGELADADARALGLERGISQNKSEFALTVDDVRRRVKVAMGRALIAEGEVAAGITALRAGSADGWDPRLFRDVAAAYVSAGDSAAAARTGAQIVVDPRTTKATADSISHDGRRRLGDRQWADAVASARVDMTRRVLAQSMPRLLRGEARVTDAAGVMRTVKSLAGRRPAVIIFWSRFCGFALEAVPEINDVAKRLSEAGTPVILVVDEPRSAALDLVVTERGLNVPVHYDVDGSFRRAFSAFGTPAYYVLDSNGRLRFRYVDEVAELLVQVTALRGE
jgi:hypothetical protein